MTYFVGAIVAVVLTAGMFAAWRRSRAHSISSTDAQLADVTIVFTNIIDFVGMFEREGDAGAVQIVNLYRETMTPIIRSHKGYLNKFIGDKMFIIFNTPINPDRDHCISAIRMILEMRGALEELNARLEKAHHSRIAMSIGVASGHAVVGDAGSPDARDYTALGDVVNIAAGLEQACKKAGRRNLVSVETASRLGDQFELRSIALQRSAITPTLAYEATSRAPTVSTP
jgi:adenylate cyclase